MKREKDREIEREAFIFITCLSFMLFFIPFNTSVIISWKLFIQKNYLEEFFFSISSNSLLLGIYPFSLFLIDVLFYIQINLILLYI